MTRPADRFVAADQWCAECGKPMHADSFGAFARCCNGWGYWAALKPSPRDSWWPAIQQRGLYLYRNESKWPANMKPTLPIEAEAGGADRQCEQRIQCPRCPALMPPGKFCKGNPPDDPCPMKPTTEDRSNG